MTAVWVVAHHHDTEEAAEHMATELVAAKKTAAAYVYPIDVEETA